MSEREHRIEYMRLDELVDAFHPDNPKSHDLGKIDVSYHEFGFVETPTLDETTGFLVAGHGRIKQLFNRMNSNDAPPDGIRIDDDGVWMSPVLRGISFKDESQVKAYLIASNQLTIAGGWDNVELASVLTEIMNDDEQLLQATGFDGDDLDYMIKQLDIPDDFPEYDESVANDVEMCTCPKCGHEFPK
jgi:hypothetical protein